MSYKLEKPYTDEQYADFVVEHNHKNNRDIVETKVALYALEPFEKLLGDDVVDDSENYNRQQNLQEACLKEAKILKELEDIDLKTIRALRAGDSEYLTKYEEQAKLLRVELSNIRKVEKTCRDAIQAER